MKLITRKGCLSALLHQLNRPQSLSDYIRSGEASGRGGKEVKGGCEGGKGEGGAT